MVREMTGGRIDSVPYVTMTIRMVREMTGGRIDYDEAGGVITVYPVARASASASTSTSTSTSTNTSVNSGDLTYAVEPDASSASYPFALAAAAGAADEDEDEDEDGIVVDMHHISDTVMSLAAIAPLCAAPVTITNVANIRIKETDRLRVVPAARTRTQGPGPAAPAAAQAAAVVPAA